ncbi:MAG TPA: helix-turn-helix transcriptional regulator [Candidatus Binatia bacterium]|nr:helix-turn-helix transcriptional regulator [Candidatus Binatia bacterium]
MIPETTRLYFRERMRIRLHQFMLREFVRRMRATGMTKRDLAKRIDKKPEQVTRWLGRPSNMTLDTISDLLLAMGMEPSFSARRLVPEAQELAESDAVEAGIGDAITRRDPPQLMAVIQPRRDAEPPFLPVGHPSAPLSAGVKVGERFFTAPRGNVMRFPRMGAAA